jgi:MFS family permease
MRTEKPGLLSTIAVLSIFFMNMGTSAVTPAIKSIADAFPHIPYVVILYVNTLPSLIGMGGTLVAGIILGRRMKYKTAALIGTGTFCLLGVLPAFINMNFFLILIIRLFFGFGLGLVSPVGNAAIVKSYEGNRRAGLLGMSAVFINIGGILLQILGGTLASIKWYYCFFAYFLGLVPFLLILFFMREPEKAGLAEHSKTHEITAAAPQAAKAKKKERIHPGIYITCAFFGICLMLNNPVMVNMSSLVERRAIGGASATGIILAAYTFGGLIGGIIFGVLYNRARRYVAALGVLCMAGGIAGVFISGGFAAMLLSTGLFGVGFSITMPVVMQLVGLLVTPATTAMGSSMVMIFMHLGGFISVYWVSLLQALFGDAVLPPIIAAFVLYLAAGLLLLLKNPFSMFSPKTSA